MAQIKKVSSTLTRTVPIQLTVHSAPLDCECVRQPRASKPSGWLLELHHFCSVRTTLKNVGTIDRVGHILSSAEIPDYDQGCTI